MKNRVMLLMMLVYLVSVFAIDFESLFKNESVDIIKTEMNKIKDINNFDEKGLTPLMYACFFSKDPEVIELIIDKGANLYLTTDAGYTCMDAAIMMNGDTRIIEKLLDMGYNINKQNGIGLTPIIIAALCPSPEIINILVKHGADVNSRCYADENKYTVLHEAVINNQNPDVVKTLLSLGAKPGMRDSKSKFAIDYAEYNKNFYNTETYKYLKSITNTNEATDVLNVKWGMSPDEVKESHEKQFKPVMESDGKFIKNYITYDRVEGYYSYDLMYRFDKKEHLNYIGIYDRKSFKNKDYYQRYLELKKEYQLKYGELLYEKINWIKDSKKLNLSIESGIEKGFVRIETFFSFENMNLYLILDSKESEFKLSTIYSEPDENE